MILKNLQVINENKFDLTLIPKRLMGQICPVDISHKGEKIASAGDRISARHIRKVESAKMKILVL